MFRVFNLTQERIVFLFALALLAAFAVFLPGFSAPDNLLALVRSVSVLGILGVAMALVVIGRGIDLSLVSLMAMSLAWSLQLVTNGMSLAGGLALGLVMSLVFGIITGFLIAYIEIPAIFATLAMGILIYGFGRLFLIDLDVVYLPDAAHPIVWIGAGNLEGIPVPVLVFVLVCALAALFLRYVKSGRFIRAIGDNPLTSRITGLPVRPVVVMQYALSAMVGFLAGLVTVTSVNSMNTRIAISTFVYDIILVVVLGGIGLSGGRGGIRNVIVGTLLIGILINGMTIMNIQYTVQNVIKSVILLAAIVADTIINPRDEQTAQQGDI
ncbi:MAG TPA: ABC transporter permease [Hypericibacter adhaerens]|jgi:ribose transport system permease protein|uniref:ABC transporter permease n=1 Tax=Hypericibacter adhaerens TaxID=2602016 RepID=A0A5J6MWW6_9PROT|nr:ABC transporter permease [Hypericibacter adhaerens]QEX20700.1 ABC transporter permease [Hypericibacter adhaerens]HWA42552.1 ABC transporter permease [Hypericibacter adhaerens]